MPEHNHEKVYVVCENKCLEEGMTKDQILTSTMDSANRIVDATTGQKWKERYLTRAEYDALGGDYEPNTKYYVVDEEFVYDRATNSDNVTESINGVQLNEIFVSSGDHAGSQVHHASVSEQSEAVRMDTQNSSSVLTLTYDWQTYDAKTVTSNKALCFLLFGYANQTHCMMYPVSNRIFGNEGAMLIKVHNGVNAESSLRDIMVVATIDGGKFKVKRSGGYTAGAVTFGGFYTVESY